MNARIGGVTNTKDFPASNAIGPLHMHHKVTVIFIVVIHKLILHWLRDAYCSI